MKRLIVNADDFGADRFRNNGIIEAIKADVLTGVSILANGPAFEDAVQQLKALGRVPVSCGLHFNLSEGKALARQMSLLVGPDGFFRGKAEAREILRIEGDEALGVAIRRELQAQIRALRDTGIRISHLDGHQHIHVFPAVLPHAVAAAREYGIPWIRLPLEPLPGPLCEMDRILAGEAALFNRLAQEASGPLSCSGISVTNHFRGLYLIDGFAPARLRKVLETLPQGLTEFMVHPGYALETAVETPFSSFSTIARERELEALRSPEFRMALTETGVRLVPFPEASL